MKHTKGEWKIKQNKSFLEVNSSREENTVMSINVFLYREFGTDKDLTNDNFCDENLANAKLIAAAPELLYRLQLAVEFLESLSSDSLEVEAMKQTIKKATE